MKLHVVFDRNGIAIGDLDAMSFAEESLNRVKGTDQSLQLNVANGIVIYAFRLLVKQGKIKPYSELFLYNKETDPDLRKPIRVDEKGEQEDYPIGMLDEYSNILCKLI